MKTLVAVPTKSEKSGSTAMGRKLRKLSRESGEEIAYYPYGPEGKGYYRVEKMGEMK